MTEYWDSKTGKVVIQRQARKTLALVATPIGLEARIPDSLDPGSERVQSFIARGLQELKPYRPAMAERPLTKAEALEVITVWTRRLGAVVKRVQFRPMRRKWGSLSANGNLTLADDILQLAPPLLEYIIVHELLHLQHPHHARNFKVALTLALPDWRDRERQLAAWLAMGTQ